MITRGRVDKVVGDNAWSGVYVQMRWNVWWVMTVFLWGWPLRIMFVRDTVFLGAVLWGCLFRLVGLRLLLREIWCARRVLWLLGSGLFLKSGLCLREGISVCNEERATSSIGGSG